MFVATLHSPTRAEDLRHFSVDTRKMVLKALGQNYAFVEKMTRQKMQEIFAVLMEVDVSGLFVIAI